MKTSKEFNLGKRRNVPVPAYIKPYGWAVYYIDKAEFKEVVEGIEVELNGNKKHPNFTYRGVERALRTLEAAEADPAWADQMEKEKEQKRRNLEQIKARLEELKAELSAEAA